MTTVQKWLTGLIGLGALALLVQNPNGTYRLAQAVNKVTAGSEAQIIKKQ